MKEYMFDLSKLIVKTISEEASANTDGFSFISFNTTIITNSSFEIIYSNFSIEISIKLEVNPLDIPWSIHISIMDVHDKTKISLNQWKKSKCNITDNIYEVSPKILKECEGEAINLARTIASDLKLFLAQN